MKTFAIETSCDDTSCAIVEYKAGFFEVKKCLLHSQIEKHKKYGGVIPELASRLHEEKIVNLIKEIGIKEIKECNFITYTGFPGLPGSLLVGKTAANTLSLFLNKEKLDVSHIHGHIFSILAERNIKDIKFPLLVLSVSGGHNEIFLVTDKKIENKLLNEYIENISKNYKLDTNKLKESLGNFTIYKLGFTLDDAAGEAFDKVSKMLGGPYPGGKWIQDKAKLADKDYNFTFPRIWLKKNEFLFSFSGLKAQVNYKIQELKKIYGEDISENLINNIAYEFQKAVVETLGKKLFKAANYFCIENIALVGGVSANEELKKYINENMKKYSIKNFYTPCKLLYSTDNAAMIGVVGILSKLNK